MLLAALAASACEPDESDPDADDALGTAAQAFANLKGEVDVSDSFGGTQRNALSPSVAWIRTPNIAGSPTKGHALVSYARREQTPTGAPYDGAAWAYSTFPFDVATPTFNEVRANEWLAGSSTFRWPAPANLCQYYGGAAECGGGGAAWSSSAATHWLAPAAALWTGLDRTAAIITTGVGSLNQTDSAAVFAVTSNDGGQSFRRSLIISTEEGGPATLGEQTPLLSGGNVVPGSVNASLAYFGERTSPVAGSEALPIYVVWLNNPASGSPPGSTAIWWWTRIVVGEDGYVTQSTPPQRLPSWVPVDVGVHVSIFGHRIDGEERVSVAWSERADRAAPNACTSASTNVAINWYASTTSDLGKTWGCFMGNEYVPPLPAPQQPIFVGCSTNQQKTTLGSFSNWPTCVTTHATSPLPNNDRPEVALSAPADVAGNGIEERPFDRYFYFALSVPTSTASNAIPKVCVYRTGSTPSSVPSPPPQDHAQLLPIGCSPSTDAGGRALSGAFAQAITVAQAALTGAGPRVEVTYRVLGKSFTGLRQEVMTFQHALFPGDTPAPMVDHLSAGDAPRDVGLWGLYSGITAYERCDFANARCPLDNFNNSTNTFFAGAWTDTQPRVPPLTVPVADARVRPFSWVP